ncbi:MAG: glycosyltransferase family 2 protein [Eubacteriales bacterium]|nr:glycosyltransferase family 2 protein [Eubacteriales bacterium]
MLELDGMLSVVMPAYNEEKLIYGSIIRTVDILSGFVKEFEIVVVNDGSKDNTKNEIKRAMNEKKCVRLVTSDKNRGKGNAIISGVSQSEGKYIAFVDADLELNPAQLEGYIREMLDKKLDVVIGCKFHKDSKLNYPIKRKIISMGYYIMLLVLFHLNVKDTQTGLKVFRAEAIKPVAHLIRTQGFAYDIELLVAVNRRGFRIGQMPVCVDYVREAGAKRIGMKDMLKAFRDTWAIFGRVYFRHYYD